MNLPEAVTKYYNLVRPEHIKYVSPVEHQRDLLDTKLESTIRIVDTVSISKEGRLLLKNKGP